MSAQTRRIAAANWLWLVDVGHRDRALLIAETETNWVAALGRHFAAVEQLAASDLRARLDDRRPSRAGDHPPLLPFDDASMDCVVLQGFVANWQHIARHWRSGTARAEILRESRRVLRRGGLLLVSGPNPRCYAAVSGGESTSTCSSLRATESDRPVSMLRRFASMSNGGWAADLRLTAAVGRAGFANVREYYAQPSDLAPRSIIPASRPAAVAYERQERTIRGRKPKLLATLGLHWMVYPALIIVAFA